MRTHHLALPGLAACAALALAAACADAPTSASVLAPGTARLGKTGTSTTSTSGTSSTSTGTTNPNSYVVSQTASGDTVTTVFVVGTNTLTAATFNIGHDSKIDFPYATLSICDPATSGYGAGMWDKSCNEIKQPIQITAKSWLDVNGKVATDFQPAIRFKPGEKRSVTLYLRDSQLASEHIDYCSPSGCVNEALTDPSVATKFDAANGFAYRIIKHFSGYTITADRY